MPIEVHVPIGFRLLKQVMVKIQYRFIDGTKMIEPLSESTPVYGLIGADGQKTLARWFYVYCMPRNI